MRPMSRPSGRVAGREVVGVRGRRRSSRRSVPCAAPSHRRRRHRVEVASAAAHSGSSATGSWRCTAWPVERASGQRAAHRLRDRSGPVPQPAGGCVAHGALTAPPASSRRICSQPDGDRWIAHASVRLALRPLDCSMGVLNH